MIDESLLLMIKYSYRKYFIVLRGIQNWIFRSSYFPSVLFSRLNSVSGYWIHYDGCKINLKSILAKILNLWERKNGLIEILPMIFQLTFSRNVQCISATKHISINVLDFFFGIVENGPHKIANISRHIWCALRIVLFNDNDNRL